MILYLDTSALLKRYFKEPHSDGVIARWKEATEIVTSSVAYAEAMASIYRKKREASLSNATVKRIVNFFQRDWESFIRVEVNDDLNISIDRIIEKHLLRGFDAVHLASALIIFHRIPENFLFACFDRKMVQAANREGMETYPADL